MKLKCKFILFYLILLRQNQTHHISSAMNGEKFYGKSRHEYAEVNKSSSVGKYLLCWYHPEKWGEKNYTKQIQNKKSKNTDTLRLN